MIQRKDMGLAHRIHVEEMRYRLARFQSARIDHGLAARQNLGNARIIDDIRGGHHTIDATIRGQRHHMFGLSMTSSGSGSRGRLAR